ALGRERRGRERAARTHRADRQPRLPGRQPAAAGRARRGARPRGDRRERRRPRVSQRPGAGRAAGGRRAAPPRPAAVPLMADVSAPARLVTASSAAPPPVPEQRSAMLERFGLLARLVVRLLFRFVHVRPEAVERLRQLARQGTLVYVMRYRSTI